MEFAHNTRITCTENLAVIDTSSLHGEICSDLQCPTKEILTYMGFTSVDLQTEISPRVLYFLIVIGKIKRYYMKRTFWVPWDTPGN